MLMCSGCVYTLRPGALSKTASRHSFPLSTNHINNTLLRPNSNKITHNFTCRRTPGWKIRLDGRTTECSTSMDRSHLELEAKMEYEDGMQHAACGCILIAF